MQNPYYVESYTFADSYTLANVHIAIAKKVIESITAIKKKLSVHVNGELHDSI